MALVVGQDFKARWLKAPEQVRQVFLDDLERIKDLLSPHTDMHSWQQREQLAQQKSAQRIEHAYAERKAELVEAQRLQRQQALEASLAAKRAEEHARLVLLEKEEQQRQLIEEKTLHILQQQLQNEMQQHLQRYAIPSMPSSSTTLSNDFSQRLARLESSTETLNAKDNLRLRLELEAESLIEQATTAFRAKLHLAAQEEIDYLIAQND